MVAGNVFLIMIHCSKASVLRDKFSFSLISTFDGWIVRFGLIGPTDVFFHQEISLACQKLNL